MSTEDLAPLTGVSRETIRKVENGHKASPRTMSAIERALSNKEAEASIVAEMQQTGARPDLVARIRQLEAEFSDLKTLVLQLLAERAR